MDIDDLKGQIKLNCNISDSKYWGHFSICGLLMRLRELYRNEHALYPWQELPQKDITEWIAEREELWKTLEDRDIQLLEIDGEVYMPFEADAVNKVLNPLGFLYGSGYAMFGKPAFFLARLEGRREIYDYQVYYTDRELCRDLSVSVAMLQGRCVFVRLENLKSLLWEKFQELKGRRFGGTLEEAFSFYGIGKNDIPSKELYKKIEDISTDISELFVLHETGEAFEDRRSDEWLGILAADKDRKAEFYIRGIKDLLADASDMGPLSFITREKDRALLYFYIVFLDGIRREIFPEMMDFFQKFAENGDWSLMKKATAAAYMKAQRLQGLVLDQWNGKNMEGILEALGRR